MESQRRGRGAGGGSGILGAWDNSTGGGGNNSNSQQHVNGGADGVIAQDCIRNLAEKHGIVVRFIDKGHASGEAQLKALARLHGIRIQILGQVDGGGGGVACGNNKEMDVETATTAEAGHGIYTAAAGGGGGGGGGEGGGGGGVWATVTPPPMLASLRPRASIVRSSSTVVAQSGLKVCAEKRWTPSAFQAGRRVNVQVAVEIGVFTRGCLCANVHLSAPCSKCPYVIREPRQARSLRAWIVTSGVCVYREGGGLLLTNATIS